jgi:hypothetical protein
MTGKVSNDAFSPLRNDRLAGPEAAMIHERPWGAPRRARHVKLKTVLSYVPGWSLAALLVWLMMLAAAGLLGTFIPSSMKLTEWAVCSEGSTVELREVRRPGKVSVYVDCVDADGTRHTGRELRAMGTMATLLFVPVFLSLVAWVFLRKEQPSAPDEPMPPLGAALDAEVRRLVEQSKRLEAVNRVRAATGVSLKRAMHYVDVELGVSERLAQTLAQGARSPAAEPSPAETLRQLKELLDAGLITPEDYEDKKAEILSRM